MSQLKRPALFLIVGTLLIVIVAAVFLVMAKFQSTTVLRIGDGVFDARIAYTQVAREQGLSGVTDFAPGQALILAFPQDGLWKIWMKDMHIPIDIVWLDRDKKVVYIVKNASPADSTNVTWTPSSPARYVLELPAGTVNSKNIKTGQAGVFIIKNEKVK